MSLFPATRHLLLFIAIRVFANKLWREQQWCSMGITKWTTNYCTATITCEGFLFAIFAIFTDLENSKPHE